MPSISISNSNVLPENLWISAEFLLLSTGPTLDATRATPMEGVTEKGEKRPEAPAPLRTGEGGKELPRMRELWESLRPGARLPPDRGGAPGADTSS